MVFTLLSKCGLAARVAILLVLVSGTFAVGATPVRAGEKSNTQALLVRVFEASSNYEPPIAGAETLIHPFTGKKDITGFTDKSGTYNTTLAPGLYLIRVSASGYQTRDVMARVEDGQIYKANVPMHKRP